MVAGATDQQTKIRSRKNHASFCLETTSLRAIIHNREEELKLVTKKPFPVVSLGRNGLKEANFKKKNKLHDSSTQTPIFKFFIAVARVAGAAQCLLRPTRSSDKGDIAIPRAAAATRRSQEDDSERPGDPQQPRAWLAIARASGSARASYLLQVARKGRQGSLASPSPARASSSAGSRCAASVLVRAAARVPAPLKYPGGAGRVAPPFARVDDPQASLSDWFNHLRLAHDFRVRCAPSPSVRPRVSKASSVISGVAALAWKGGGPRGGKIAFAT
jgi:hypothetical protein